MLAPPPDAPLAGASVSELCLKNYVNVFGLDAFLAEKPNDGPLVLLHPLNDNCKRADLVTIIRNILLVRRHCDSLFQAAQ
jgi:hypothetical protein